MKYYIKKVKDKISENTNGILALLRILLDYVMGKLQSFTFQIKLMFHTKGVYVIQLQIKLNCKA